MKSLKKLLVFALVLTFVLPVLVLSGCPAPTPMTAQDYYDRGIALSDKGNHDEAIAAFDKAIELDPEAPDYYAQRGKAYEDKEQYDPAIADYSKAIELDPGYLYAYASRGIAYILNYKPELAIADFTKVIEVEPSAENYIARGLAYKYNQQYELAIADFNRAVEMSTDTDTTDFAKDKLAELEQSTVTAQIAAQASEHDKNGVALANAGSSDEAIAEFTRAVEIAPDYATAYNNRGMVYLNRQQYSTAITDFSYAIEIEETNTFAYENRAIAYGEQGQFEEALADLDKAVAIDPSSDGAWNNRGMALEELSRPEEAVKSYDTALQLNPDNQAAKDNKSDVIDSDYKPLRGCIAVRTGQPCLTHPWTPDRVVYRGRPYSHTEYGPRVEERQTVPEPVIPVVPDGGRQETGAGISIDYAVVAREVAENYMYAGNIEMRKVLSQAALPQGTSWQYTYSIQEPQNAGGATWQVPVNVFFSTSINIEDFSYSVGFDGLEVLTVDVISRQVLSEEVISYTMR